jgi:ribosomal protein S3
LKYGRIQSSNIANKIVYDTVSQKTKYGVWSIKVWVAHKIK